MGNTSNPCLKLAVLGIATLFYSHDNLHEGLLKDILRKLFVTYYEINVRMNATFVSI